MIRLFPSTASPRDQIQSRLMSLAAVFLFLYACILTLSPAVRLRSWVVDYRWQHWAGFIVWLVGFAIIHRRVVRSLPDRDPYILSVAALLTGWGLLEIWRIDSGFGLRQTLWLAIGLVVLRFGLRQASILTLLRRYKYLWLTGGLLLTALTFILGTYPGGQGPHLWLGCCGVYLQPSEPLKLLLVVYLAAYMADRMPVSFSLMQLLTPTLVVLGTAMLILLAQRDLGAASLFMLVYFTIIYLASGRRRMLAFGLVAILAASVTGYLLFDVIRLRVNALINPWADPTGRSYQIVQSLIAVGSGGVLGSGVGMGSPGVVPVAHSDFIFAAIAEETGLFGMLAVLLLIGLLAGRCLLAALHAGNNYQRYLAAGLATSLTMQSILIIGGNLRLLPLTGVTLPFVSYGGSSLLTAFVSLLLLLLISNQPENDPAPLPTFIPYQLAGTALLAVLAGIALTSGWYSAIRGSDLQVRPDNPRSAITDRYVPRGQILDRRNRPIVTSAGSPGDYVRQTSYPQLGIVTGYSHPLYGQAGLEASLDGYLRGLEGTPSSLVWFNDLLYSQRPPGLNIRLSIDLDLQSLADKLLQGRKGALVLLNARSGEILAMSSHPNFNPNQIDEDLALWNKDPDSPLLNRTTQGAYPAGGAMAPFLLSANLANGSLPTQPAQLSLTFQGHDWGCANNPVNTPDWSSAVSGGCPGAALELGQMLGPEAISSLYRGLGLGDAPELSLPVVQPSIIPDTLDVAQASLGQAKINVSPLQMALAVAALSTNGTLPAPLLALAVETPAQGWVVLHSGQARASLKINGIATTTDRLAVPGQPLWQSTSSAWTANHKITWFLGGTASAFQGNPVAVALVLEEDNPPLAQSIGQTLLVTTIH